ncbi:MAG: hypothetical protein M3N68_11815 [Actinomycetota bacterium]|nr:hypothetical protein [Actinomycetota bacterium]
MDLRVDVAMLADTAADLRQAVGVAAEVAERRGELTSLVGDAGSAALSDAAAGFVEEWGYGMGLVVDDAEKLATMLGTAADTYARTEQAIVEGLR